jgi:hypothetical protein
MRPKIDVVSLTMITVLVFSSASSSEITYNYPSGFVSYVLWIEEPFHLLYRDISRGIAK